MYENSKSTQGLQGHQKGLLALGDAGVQAPSFCAGESATVHAPPRCVSGQAHRILLECAEPRASVLSAARKPQQRKNRNVSKR